MDSEILEARLGLTARGIESLSQRGLIRRRQQTYRPKKRLDYEALSQTYRQLLETGQFKTYADLARHLGVSRGWVSRVLKGIKKKIP